jgi:hypothetical protein
LKYGSFWWDEHAQAWAMAQEMKKAWALSEFSSLAAVYAVLRT